MQSTFTFLIQSGAKLIPLSIAQSYFGWRTCIFRFLLWALEIQPRSPTPVLFPKHTLSKSASVTLFVCLSLFLSCFLKFVFGSGSHKSSLWKYLCTWHISNACLDFNKAIFFSFFYFCSIFLSRGRSLSWFFFLWLSSMNLGSLGVPSSRM